MTARRQGSSRRSSRRRFSTSQLSLTFAEGSLFGWATVALLVLALVVGGASRENALQTLVIELAALILLPFAIIRCARFGLAPQARLPLVVIALMAAIVILQLIPLPPALWTALPGRELAVSAYQAAGLSLPWLPISLAPQQTLRAGLTLIVPVSMFLATLTAPVAQRRAGGMAVLAVVLVGLAFGAAQLGGGADSPAYLYETTNRGLLVGLFSNRNHQASLLLCALPLAAAFVSLGHQKRDRMISIILALGLLLIVVVALGAGRSRAGVLLLAPAALAALLIVWRAGGGSRKTMALTLGLGGVLVAGILVILKFGLSGLMERFDSDVGGDLRFQIGPDIWTDAVSKLPFGVGLGDFENYYRSIERLETMGGTFVNHAHNDYLEVLLGAGLPAVLILGVFLYWFGRRAFEAWTARWSPGLSLIQAATVVVAILLVHSLVDYPLRTLALSSLFAFCCGLLTPGPDEPPANDHAPRRRRSKR